MTRRMFRYEVPVDGQSHDFALACHWSGPVHVEAAGDDAVEFWAEHNSDDTERLRSFQIFRTGHELPDDALWCGTTQRTPNGFIWHLYEVEAVSRS